MRMMYRAATVLLVGVALAGCGNKDAGVTQAGEVNLAGCEVPAGTKRADAEAVTCDKAAPPAGAAESSAPTAAAPAIPDAQVIDAALADAAKKSDGGTEYKEARKSAEGDLTGDGKADVAVLYTLEGEGGANAANAYLAVFQRAESGQLSLAGTTSVAGFGTAAQGLSVVDGTIHVKVLVPGPDDPDCCPSQEQDALYVLHLGKLMEVQG